MFEFAEKWSDFWFKELPARNLAIFRLLFGIPLFFLYLNRHFYLEEFYSDEGIVPLANVADVFLPFTYPPFLWHVTDFAWIPFAHLAFLGLLLLMCFGLLPRPFGFVLWLLHMSFLQRNFSIVYGVDILAGIWLFYLSFTSSHGYHLISWLKGTMKSRKTDMFSSVGYRLIQVHLCVIYVYTGIEKLKGSSWWDGTALWRVFGNPQMVVADMSFVLHFPWVVAIITFLTLLFEIYFPALIWLRNWRGPLILLGLFFHTGIGVTLALPVFSMSMMATYILFYDDHLPFFSQRQI